MARQVELYKIPESFEVASVLGDEVLEAYNESVKQQYNSEKARQTLSKFGASKGELIGSSPFMNVQLIKSLPQKVRLATSSYLEEALSFDCYFLRDNYYDVGLVLASEGDFYTPNDLLARRLAEQLKKRGIKLGGGKLIHSSNLQIQEEPNSAYGLVFDLNDNTTIFSIQDLRDLEWIHSRNYGLSRVGLNRFGDWDFNDEDLGLSLAGGRVVIVKIASGSCSRKEPSIKLPYNQREIDKEIKKLSRLELELAESRKFLESLRKNKT